MGAKAVETLLWWLVLMALNVLFISTVSPLELEVSAGLALLGAVAAGPARRAARARLGGLTGAPAALAALPRTLVSDLVLLVRVLLRPASATGGVRTVALPAGTGPAWACTLLSATPGTCVLDVSAPADGPVRLTVHTLDAAPSAVERAVGVG
ncbi:hypothetical protein [Streptomyces tateyamensis]|uniref:hypothetical protein n=1 Tax=Streptomyces tateyamensis TaxID=565073 RepID=UPI0015E8CD77|nr:hypothetical protein [Streptomyces tateyamensis]